MKDAAEAVSAPTDHSPSGVRTWIRTLCRQIGTTPTELAASSGLAASTLNRFMRSTDPKKNISASTIERLVAGALQMTEEDGFVERSQPNGRIKATLPCAEGDILVDMPKVLQLGTAEAALAWFKHLLTLTTRDGAEA